MKYPVLLVIKCFYVEKHMMKNLKKRSLVSSGSGEVMNAPACLPGEIFVSFSGVETIKLMHHPRTAAPWRGAEQLTIRSMTVA